ncbi:hypothetical protein PHYBLDRAFT_173279 [Phycomyces blakesleeanus NRRL 1555(-)]|uniref:Uncharacterized protein n=1 Tax=Phycomyces blakesleeanus (strain ATCC 8743b / DSM 1359 / FGSC 10004 / NBRC 33097 / NRRL 1555) TaxID=763407 RepID=A0A162TMA7_PHYB8|nr:hypothetical protein PHYBLDRAFT_173279 [Phycomyces blakesleeanus NRRL 1555(-)]OAD68273.1 hypothetical protein PHYBLDRAFT_173279 [Phycomyces blakesleeanus NRRL 1555(-)]|eukprot:XP_018286313.1 hypothetical protein PHYBLDRAFT_173279 [Phycomyces blakesleeanus NRRL 1555(-)]
MAPSARIDQLNTENNPKDNLNKEQTNKSQRLKEAKEHPRTINMKTPKCSKSLGAAFWLKNCEVYARINRLRSRGGLTYKTFRTGTASRRYSLRDHQGKAIIQEIGSAYANRFQDLINQSKLETKEDTNTSRLCKRDIKKAFIADMISKELHREIKRNDLKTLAAAIEMILELSKEMDYDSDSEESEA